MPPNTVKVDRSTPWGNPCIVTPETTPAEAVAAFRDYLDTRLSFQFEIIRELRGKNLGCWCKIGEPCHGDVLLEIANAE